MYAHVHTVGVDIWDTRPVNNIIDIGEASGIKIKKRDPTVDRKGQHVNDQFDVVITDHRIEVPITITCLHFKK